MSFVEVRFPEDISYGSSGGPVYSTDVVVTDGGFEKRNINWQSARARYNVAHGVKTQTQLDNLISFFRARKGRAYGFRFKDWSDYTASGQDLGTGDGVATDFQLVKSYNSGGVVENRAISKLVDGSLVVYFDGAVVSSGFTVDLAAGLMVFDTPPAIGVVLTVDFEFDVPVRFDTDALNSVLEDYGLHSWADIPLIELRV